MITVINMNEHIVDTYICLFMRECKVVWNVLPVIKYVLVSLMSVFFNVLCRQRREGTRDEKILCE